MKVAVLTNPNSGRGKAASTVKYVERLLEKRGYIPVIHYSSSNLRSKSLAKHISFRYKKLIAVGGDSTINEVVNGIANSKCCLGIIPIGEANILAEQLEIPGDVEGAIAIAIDGEKRKIDLGRVNGRYFSIICGVGFNAEIISEVKPIFKDIFRNVDFSTVTIPKMLKKGLEHMLIKIDNNLLSEGYFMVIANSKYYGDYFSIAREADLSDGYLDVCIFKKDNVADFLKNISAVLNDKNFSSNEIEYYRAKTIEVQSENPVLVQTDGDVVEKTPAKIAIQPKVLSLMVQRK